ncbi:MAG: hypothetical protein IJ279_03095 [Clostridia bacterium]|nr:hypothetical protein [Clostridia bacterium]
MAFVGFWMLPLAFFLSLFSPIIGFFETLMGLGVEEVALPHDPESGIVWEYKEDENDIFDCLKTEIKDGQQIFTFRGKGIAEEGRPSGYDGDEFVDDIFFEDENSNIKKYYAFVDFSALEDGGSYMYGDMDIYEESECATFEYTVKPEEETENRAWHVFDNSARMKQNRFMGTDKLENMHERTYQFVFSPEDIKDGTFSMTFYYGTPSYTTFEKIEVTFEMKEKEVTIVEETHYVTDEHNNFVEVERS